MAVDHRGVVCPAIAAARDVGDVHGPALVARRGAATPTLCPGAGRGLPLADEPVLDAADRLLIDLPASSEAKPDPRKSVPKGRKPLDEVPGPLGKKGVGRTFAAGRRLHSRGFRRRPRDLQYPTDTALRGAEDPPHCSGSPNILRRRAKKRKEAAHLASPSRLIC